ncbi:hypothetical protein, partial [Microcystis sp. Msp_OC_L_20101000_S702]|uniref:hypothetical protein n=1 Tax=Microcystis sp. Msp_OC_L_20101000_S702 TaxID=2486218 RepID=UPI002579F343
DQARGLKTDRVPIIFINKYFTQFIPGKQESYATTTESLPKTSPKWYIIKAQVPKYFGSRPFLF